MIFELLEESRHSPQWHSAGMLSPCRLSVELHDVHIACAVYVAATHSMYNEDTPEPQQRGRSASLLKGSRGLAARAPQRGWARLSAEEQLVQTDVNAKAQLERTVTTPSQRKGGTHQKSL